jgi:hypothetical protein
MDFKKLRILFICVTGFFLGMPAVVFAGADSGFYIGAGVGDASVKDGDLASYVDFGNPSTSAGNVEVTGLNAFGLAGLSFGPFGIFAKAGVINWDVDSTFGTVNSSDSGSDPAYGVGARFAIGSFAVRAEYEVYDLEADLDMVSVSGVFTF